MKAFIVALLMITGYSISSQAIDLTYKFEVENSAPTIYPCNAGLRHVFPKAPICVIEGTTTPCSQGNCVGGNCTQRCSCTGVQGGALPDEFEVTYGKFDEHKTATFPYTGVVVADGSSFYNQLFSDDASWTYRLDQLGFKFGSEAYGTEYFVDICYRGPQLEFKGNHRFVIEAEATAKNFLETKLNYLSLAGIENRIEVGCDLTYQGKYKKAPAYNSLVNDAYLSKSSDFYKQFSSASLINKGRSVGPVTISTGQSTPRFCKVRYFYKEANTKTKRKWEYHGGDFCTHTTIEDPNTSN